MKRLILPLLLIVLFSGCTVQTPTEIISSEKLRACPTQEIINQMPGGSGSHYYIINGSSVDANEIDTEWVTENCPIFLSSIVS